MGASPRLKFWSQYFGQWGSRVEFFGPESCAWGAATVRSAALVLCDSRVPGMFMIFNRASRPAQPEAGFRCSSCCCCCGGGGFRCCCCCCCCAFCFYIAVVNCVCDPRSLGSAHIEDGLHHNRPSRSIAFEKIPQAILPDLTRLRNYGSLWPGPWHIFLPR